MMSEALRFMGVVLVLWLASLVQPLPLDEWIEAGMRGSVEATRWPHKPEIEGSNPSPAITVIICDRLEEGYLDKKVVPKTTSSREPMLHRFRVTFYTNEQGDPPGSDVTASGVKTSFGMVACPVAFWFGTRFVLLMPWGPEEFVCQDRFADPAHWGLDVWVPNEVEGAKWAGEHWVLVLFDSQPLEEYDIVIEGQP